MDSRVSQITDPVSTNIVYDLQVFADGSWKLYPHINGTQDWANVITKLEGLKMTIRQQVELEIGRHIANLNAQKSS